MALDLILKNAQIADSAGHLSPCDIGVKDGDIVEISKSVSGDAEVVDAGGGFVSAGAADSWLAWSEANLSREKRVVRLCWGQWAH